ncbi:MAG: aspartate/glutamate racemase family protein [Rhodobacteraceae bacterium]|nr:aspartate/glutamate racemase family protein [Paracoccaceae bacterium]
MSATGRILVINPNSNPEVTQGFSEALTPLRLVGGPEIECVTLEEGPFGVETQEHVEQVTLPLRRLVLARGDVSAYVIACYSDPGLAVCREATSKPVFGIQESGILSAMARGEQLGVIALGPKSIVRHMRYLRQMAVMDRIAGERPLNLSVAAAERPEAFARLVEIAKELRDLDSADVLILGCAGMARHRHSLEEATGLPVIDPVQAATADAMASVLLARSGV